MSANGLGNDYFVTINAPGVEQVLLTLPFLSDHAARSYGIKLETNWIRRCEVTICRPDGFLIYQTDSRKRRSQA